MAMKLDNSNFDQILKQDQPVLVDFWATWCGPCRMVGPIIEQVAADFEGKAIVGKVDVDECGELAMRYGVMSIPTVILFKDGLPVEQLVGASGKASYAAMINKHL